MQMLHISLYIFDNLDYCFTIFNLENRKHLLKRNDLKNEVNNIIEISFLKS